MIITDAVGLSVFMARRTSQVMALVLAKTTMGADKPTHRALLWDSAAALQRL